MQALGLIETEGLVAAIISADAMVKAANVKILDKTYVGGGLVSIAVTGDVGAVQAAVEAGTASVKAINHLSLISQHVIPRPHKELENTILLTTTPLIEEEIFKEVEVEIKEEVKKVDKQEERGPVKVEEKEVVKEEIKKLASKKDIDNIVSQQGLEEGIKSLNKLKVVELRELARKYDKFGIKGRDISKAGKDLLIKEFRKYYKK